MSCFCRSINPRQLASLPAVLLLCLFSVVSLLAQAPEVRNPRTSPADIAAGARIFRAQCSLCHGLDGSGGQGPDLTRSELDSSLSDADLFRLIAFGIPGTAMYPSRFSDRRVWQTAAFVRTRSRARERVQLPGDPEHGKDLFWGGKGQCSQCHMVGGEGGRRGPSLSAIGRQRAPGYLRESLLKPSQVAGTSDIVVQGFRRYWPVSVTDLQGNVREGVLLGEDTYSIQLMDEEERLLSVLKRDLSEIRRGRESVMPGYEEVFSASELDDLIAYLSSLRGERTR